IGVNRSIGHHLDIASIRGDDVDRTVRLLTSSTRSAFPDHWSVRRTVSWTSRTRPLGTSGRAARGPAKPRVEHIVTTHDRAHRRIFITPAFRALAPRDHAPLR